MGTTRKSVVIVVLLVLVVGITAKDAIQSARESSRQRQCWSNLRHLWSASMMYAQDYDGWLPPYVTRKDAAVGSTRGIPSPEKLHSALAKYVRDQSAWFCPSALRAERDERFDRILDSSYTTYYFNFRAPGILRTDGPHNISPEALALEGKPSEYALILEQSLYHTRRSEKLGGPHTDGAINVIHLDGRLERIVRD